MRRGGSDSPTADNAARTRSRLSATALSPRPTMEKATAPDATCTSTATGTASIPRKAIVVTRLNIDLNTDPKRTNSG
ncbi:MAG: hypothetical protein AcusKO_32430 [Acuticoccus sp.]